MVKTALGAALFRGWDSENQFPDSAQSHKVLLIAVTRRPPALDEKIPLPRRWSSRPRDEKSIGQKKEVVYSRPAYI